MYSPTPKVYGTQLADGKPLKMSKSYNNTVKIFAPDKELKKTIMGIETSSTPMTEAMPTDDCLVFQMYCLFASDAEQREMRENYQRSDFGYGHAKKALATKVFDYFADARTKYSKLLGKPNYLNEVLEDGATRANAIATAKLNDMRNAVGTRRFN